MVYVGRQRVCCILLHCIVCVFSHPSFVQREGHEARLAIVCVGCQRVLFILPYGIVGVLSHPTEWSLSYHKRELLHVYIRICMYTYIFIYICI